MTNPVQNPNQSINMKFAQDMMQTATSRLNLLYSRDLADKDKTNRNARATALSSFISGVVHPRTANKELTPTEAANMITKRGAKLKLSPEESHQVHMNYLEGLQQVGKTLGMSPEDYSRTAQEARQKELHEITMRQKNVSLEQSELNLAQDKKKKATPTQAGASEARKELVKEAYKAAEPMVTKLDKFARLVARKTPYDDKNEYFDEVMDELDDAFPDAPDFDQFETGDWDGAIKMLTTHLKENGSAFGLGASSEDKIYRALELLFTHPKDRKTLTAKQMEGKNQSEIDRELRKQEQIVEYVLDLLFTVEPEATPEDQGKKLAQNALIQGGIQSSVSYSDKVKARIEAGRQRRR